MLSPTAEAIINAARERVISRQNPLLESLPDKFEDWFDVQRDAVNEIIAGFQEADVVVLEGPPGTGKTLIAETVRRILNPSRSLYLCTTKSLQDQFAGDFPYAKVIKGRSNYPTELHPERFGSSWDSLTTADCTKSKLRPNCKWCSDVRYCPYERAKGDALRSKLAIANTSYFLTEANGVGRFSGWPFVIVDECDTLAGELSRHVTLSISEKKMARYGISAPSKVTVESSWMDWAVETAPKLAAALKKMPLVPSNVGAIRERKWLESTLYSLATVAAGIEEGGWIYTGDRQRVEFKPVLVNGLGAKWVWRHSPKWLLMSGTVISAELRLQELGYEGSWRFVAIPSTFPAENRRVVVRPVAEMTHKLQDTERGKLIGELRRICSENPNSRILVHSVSYSLTKFIRDLLASLPRTVISYESASGRGNALEKYLSTEGSILVAPSLDRGIDLPQDACRVQVIAKVPYPNLGDKQVSARVYGTGRQGRNWFNLETVSTLVQMTGRAVRSKDDWAVCYILDKQFQNLWANARPLFPAYWRDGLVWE